MSTPIEVERLMEGPLHWFLEWPIADLPPTGVYTIWDREDNFIYVGVGGIKEGGGRKGMWGRLNAHANGRRSGNQFCIYVSDRFVLPNLRDKLADIGAGLFNIDAATGDYIRSNFGFRFSPMSCGVSARKLERQIQRGKFGQQPFLNAES